MIMVHLKNSLVDFGTSNIIGLFSQVDRTALDTCQKDVDEFVRNYGVNYSALNCRVFKDLDTHSHCSINPYFGIHMEPPKLACLPKDLLDKKYVVNDGFLNGNLSSPIISTCKYECSSRHYILKVNQGGLDLKPLEALVEKYREADPDYVGLNAEEIKAGDFIVFNFYFESFDFTRIVLSQETFTDLLCKYLYKHISILLKASISIFSQSWRMAWISHWSLNHLISGISVLRIIMRLQFTMQVQLIYYLEK